MTVNWISRIPTLSYMEMGFSRLKNPRIEMWDKKRNTKENVDIIFK